LAQAGMVDRGVQIGVTIKGANCPGWDAAKSAEILDSANRVAGTSTAIATTTNPQNTSGT
jgi:hypothetical protein